MTTSGHISPEPPEPPAELLWGVPLAGPMPSGEQGGRDAVAIWSFVLGLIAVVPVSVVLGIVALVRKRPYGARRGKGFAIAGLALSGVWTLALAGGVVVVAVMYHGLSSVSSTSTPAGTVLIDEVKPGTCFDVADETSGLVRKRSCVHAHDAQMVGMASLPGSDTYPGDAKAVLLADAACIKAEYAAIPDVRNSVPGDASINYLYPDRDSWTNGDRDAACYLEGDGKLSSPIPESTPRYSAAQRAYLGFERQRLIPTDTYGFAVEDGGWAASRPFAAKVAEAERAQAAALAGHAWPASARSAARALAAAEIRDAGYWDRIASAKGHAAWSKADQAETDNNAGEVRTGVLAMRAAVELPS
jgi:hypothetical protein